ncbi:hypothetical protein, partial [Citrobacter youngae]|uniref:hypothetical protein n=1 Tax=Citrobacter youngae TaxID=133448 RepID=UPI001EF7EE20
CQRSSIALAMGSGLTISTLLLILVGRHKQHYPDLHPAEPGELQVVVVQLPDRPEPLCVLPRASD